MKLTVNYEDYNVQTQARYDSWESHQVDYTLIAFNRHGTQIAEGTGPTFDLAMRELIDDIMRHREEQGLF